MTAQRPPPCRGPLLCRTKSFTDPVSYGRPRPCRTKSESQASTSQPRPADRRQGKRKALARPNGARTSSAKARAGRPSDQAVPEQSQDTHRGKHQPQLRQADRCHGKRRALARPCGARTSSARPSGARASARHPPGQAPAEQIPIKAIAGHPPGQAPAEQTHQTKQHQTKRRQVYKLKSPASMETGDFSCRDPELLVAVL